MQLLKITSLPIKLQYEMESARLEMRPYQKPEGRITREQSHLSIQSRNIEVRMDTTALRESLNLRSNGSWASYFAQKGRSKAQSAVGEAVQTGNQMESMSIADIVRQKLIQQPTTMTTFLPEQGPDISWQPNDQTLNYDPGSVSLDWQLTRNVMDFVPGKFQMNILQYPKVQIEYVGRPNYVPPSADPQYVEKFA